MTATDDTPMLNASATRSHRADTLTIDFATHRRSDPLTPYTCQSESDVDDPGYRPGGQRYRSASLVIPDASGANELGAYGLALRFASVASLDALMEHLHQLRPILAETFPDDFWADPSNTVTVENGHLVCPYCRAEDTIVEHDATSRTNSLRLDDGEIVADFGDMGNWETDHFGCKKCDARVFLPDGKQILYP
ncbi:hypothetical protein AB0F17_43260 [Nonomuraea sp. NPDC026600]|uniref:hypothetical protein n=1 Tax=Nonomuraea sp. NPDC026600 TaxID=3155363 RepID=UPI0033D113BA